MMTGTGPLLQVEFVFGCRVATCRLPVRAEPTCRYVLLGTGRAHVRPLIVVQALVEF